MSDALRAIVACAAFLLLLLGRRPLGKRLDRWTATRAEQKRREGIPINTHQTSRRG